MLVEFNTKKIRRQLIKYSKEENLTSDAAIFLIINEMEIYNAILSDYNQSPAKNAKIYQTLLQMSGMIYNHLQGFNCVPQKKKAEEKTSNNSRLLEVIERVKDVS